MPDCPEAIVMIASLTTKSFVSTVVCAPWTVRLPVIVISAKVTVSVVPTAWPIWTPVELVTTPVPALTNNPEELDTNPFCALTDSVLEAAIVPPPAKPSPATTDTDEWSMFSFATYPERLCISMFVSFKYNPEVLDTNWLLPTFKER